MNQKRSMKRITTHPGEILSKDIFPAAGLDVASAAKIFEMTLEDMQSVLDCAAPVTKELSHKLGAYFKNSPEFWQNLQNAHDISAHQMRSNDRVANGRGRKRSSGFHRAF